MKRIFSTLLVLFVLGFNTSYAQLGGALEKLSKEGSKAAADTKTKTTNSILGNLDKQLKDQFKLDGVKSQVLGDALKIKVADSDFKKLSASAKNKQGNQIIDAANGILTNGGLNLKGLGIKNIILELVSSLSLNDILQTFKRPI